MISVVYSIFDVKAKHFGVPFYAPNKAVGLRNVQSLVRDGSASASMLSRFPEDFVLYDLGTFDDERGVFELRPAPDVVCNLVQLKGDSNAPA